MPRAHLLTLLTFFLAFCSCRGVGPDRSVVCAPLKLAADSPHVVLIVLENQNYDGMFGNPHAAFFNSFAAENALATNFFANTHPSLGDYFMMTTGQIISNDLNFA